MAYPTNTIKALSSHLSNSTERQLRQPTKIYIVEAVGFQVFKVGSSIQPTKRLHDLQVGSPIRLVILGQWNGTREDEWQILTKLLPYHLHSEWFAAPLSIVADAVASSLRMSTEQLTADLENERLRIVDSRTTKGQFLESPLPIVSLPICRALNAPPVVATRPDTSTVSVRAYQPPAMDGITWQRKTYGALAVWHIPYVDCPKSRRIHLGFIDTDQIEAWMRGGDGFVQWVSERRTQLGLSDELLRSKHARTRQFELQ